MTGKPFTDAAGNACVTNSIISAGCISPVAKKLLALVPTSPSGTISSLAASPRRGDLFMTRVDWNLSEKHRIYGHFFYNHNTRTNPFPNGGTVPGYMGESFVQDTRHVVVNDTYNFRPTLLNEVTFSFLDSRSNQLQTKTIDALGVRHQPAAVRADRRGDRERRRQLHARIGLHDAVLQPELSVPRQPELDHGQGTRSSSATNCCGCSSARYSSARRASLSAGLEAGNAMADFMLGASTTST